VQYVTGKWQHGWLNLDGIQFATKSRRSVALRNGWKAYGGSYGSPSYTKTGSVCEVEGLIRGSRWGAAMVQLPSNCRPKKRLIFNLNNHRKTARVDVLKNGQVKWVAGGRSHGWISLGGIMFSAHGGIRLSTSNGWKSYGGSYGKVAVDKTGVLCLVSGLLKGTKWGKTMATLPKECRPKSRLIFNMNNHQRTARVDVLKNGQIVWVAGGRSHSWVSVTGITIHRVSKLVVKPRRIKRRISKLRSPLVRKLWKKAVARAKRAAAAKARAKATAAPRRKIYGRRRRRASKRGGTSSRRRRRSAQKRGGVRRINLQNGWKPYGRGYAVPTTTKDGNLCVVGGLIKRSSMRNPLTTLPPDCRPNKRLIFNLNNNANTLRVDVLKNGQVRYVTGKWKRGWINLDGIQFATKSRRSVALRNGWKAYGGSYGSPTYTKTGSVCEVEGLIKGKRWGLAMVQLPSNCRPKKRLIFNLNNHKKTARVDVLKNGQVAWVHGGRDHGWISLGGIVFSTQAGRGLPLLNGWRSYGGSYGKVTVAKNKRGSLCLVSGVLKGSKWGLPMALLPKECRPKRRSIFNMNSDKRTARVDVLTNGKIVWIAGGPQPRGWLSLSGITIRTD
jgi:hypothetical protein